MPVASCRMAAEGRSSVSFETIATKWAALKPSARLVIITESARLPLAEKIRLANASYVKEIGLINLTANEPYEEIMRNMTAQDVLLILLTMDGFMNEGYRDIFPPFDKPDGFAGKYVFIRLDIPEASLLAGLHTSLAKVEAIIRTCQTYKSGQQVRVTTEKGTDITMVVDYQELLPYDARLPGGHAFLPPAEISEELVVGSANGVIVADITVGELRFYADLIDLLGFVDEDVKITVKDGLVTDITGGEIARRLQAGLAKQPKALQTLVELGHGLSDLSPTGIIGVDESMNGTCHFGIGNRDPYHVDVVVANPCISIVKENPHVSIYTV